jgi:hypothetical protein
MTAEPERAVRDLSTRFKPGQSGNPSGRTPMPPEIREALKAATPRAVERLVELMESEDERVALTASETVLSRVYGKPVQATEAKIETTDVSALHLRALEMVEQRRAERLEAEAQAKRADVIEAVVVEVATTDAEEDAD